MKTSKNRQIVSFYELPEEWQIEALSIHGGDAEEVSYIAPLKSHNPRKHALNDLSECMRCDHPLYDGVIVKSNSSAIGVKLSDCGESCDLFFI